MITDIYRKAGNRTGSRTVDARGSTERWYVETDEVQDVDSILSEFVQPGQITTDGRRVENLSAADTDDGYSWEVDVTYSNNAVENPLNEPVRVSGSQSPRQIAVDFDRDGNAILNTAGDPFQEILFAEDFDDTLQLSYNSATVPFAAAQAAKRTVSSGTMFGLLGPGTVRYAGMNFQPMDHELIGIYYAITIGLAVAEDWKSRLLNQGFREKVDGELKVILVDGKATQTPSLLAADGTKLAADGTPVTLEKEIYRPVDYVALFGLTDV